jgi:chorismate synthase
MWNSIGRIFVVTTFGESHGPAVGVVIDGCPPRLKLSEADIRPQLARRRPGQSRLTTSRDEADRVEILSGVERGLTLGSPIALMVRNANIRPGDYEGLQNIPRPSHADLTYRLKYGITASSGGGRASARETVGRVAAGAVAEKFLKDRHGVDIVAWVSAVGDVAAHDLTGRRIKRAEVDRTAVRCPDPRVAEHMAKAVLTAKREGDSIGGVVTCVCRGVPPGWGEPVFGKMSALLAGAMLSIPAAKGFEIGSGFAGARMRGSEHNDPFVGKGRRLGTLANRDGGVQGGITNGEPIVFRVAFKPPPSIARPQRTADYRGRPAVLRVRGRHDSCVVPRAVPVVEAMAALVLADSALMAAAAS